MSKNEFKINRVLNINSIYYNKQYLAAIADQVEQPKPRNNKKQKQKRKTKIK